MAASRRSRSGGVRATKGCAASAATSRARAAADATRDEVSAAGAAASAAQRSRRQTSPPPPPSSPALTPQLTAFGLHAAMGGRRPWARPWAQRMAPSPPPLWLVGPPLLLALLLLLAPLADASLRRVLSEAASMRAESSEVSEQPVASPAAARAAHPAPQRPLGWETAGGKRHLLEWRSEDDDDEEDELEDAGGGSGASGASVPPAPTVPPPPHRHRHQKSHEEERLGPRRGARGHAPDADPLAPSPPSASSPSPSPAPPSSSGPRRRLRAHEACYSSNEVLLVIGVTCAVNFAFILLVVSLVHLCNRGASKAVPPSPQFESLGAREERSRRRGCGGVSGGGCGVGGGSGGGGEGGRCGGGGGGGGGSGGSAPGNYVRVQEYVDSLPDRSGPFEEEDEEEEEEVLAAGSGAGAAAAVAAANSASATAASACRPPRRRPAPLGLHGACSMEELLFLD